MLSVANKNGRKADTVLSRMEAAIRSSLLKMNIKPTILNQILSKETDRAQLADLYGLSEGKLLIMKI